jgi:exonuclease SbcC
MWIKQLRLENFQSHKETVLNFHPNFNTIVGTGNSGKSAIVRALSFILFGQWESSWVRNGASGCKIALTMDDGTEVVREKGSKVNKYTLRIPGAKEQVYENFGTRVPEEIEKALHIFKAQIGDKEELNLNLSSQLDNLFLLSNTGSYRAKVMGKLSKAHYIDFALRELNKDKKRLSAEKYVVEEQAGMLEEELLRYTDLDERKQALDGAGQRIERVAIMQSRLDKLKDLARRTGLWKEAYVRETEAAQDLQKLSVKDPESLVEFYDRLKKLRDLQSRVKQFKQVYENTKTSLEQIDRSSVLATEKYIDILKSNQKCPTCFAPLGDDQCSKIVENLK